MKKALGIFICLCIASYFSAAYAHNAFTWFGFKNDNAQVVINSSTPYHGPICNTYDCGRKKPKHRHHKKPPKYYKHNKCFWWWRN